MDKEIKGQCSATVPEGLWSSHQCSKKAKVNREGRLYCTIHDPEYIKKKDEKEEEKWREMYCKECKEYIGRFIKEYNFCPKCGIKLNHHEG